MDECKATWGDACSAVTELDWRFGVAFVAVSVAILFFLKEFRRD